MAAWRISAPATRVTPSSSPSAPPCGAPASPGGGTEPASAGSGFVPSTTMVAAHFLHLILTVFPATFSSAMVYFDPQD
jgi:hypothetical protein